MATRLTVRCPSTTAFPFTDLTAPTGWTGTSRRPDNWTIEDYIDEWIEYSEAVRDDIQAQDGYEDATPSFQGCAYTAPRADDLENSTTWNVANTVRLGLGDSDMLVSVADHDVRAPCLRRQGCG